MNETIPDLMIATTTDGLIELEQQNGLDDPDRIQIHPLHVRLMAERLGLVPVSDVNAARTVATMVRRLQVLHARIDNLAEWLAVHSDHEHADLSYEMTYARATADIADEFCADLPQPVEQRPDGDATPITPSNATSRQEPTAQAVLDLAHSYFAAP
jgi:hypothetical protein